VYSRLYDTDTAVYNLAGGPSDDGGSRWVTEPKARALFARLRDDLIAGTYQPGEKLTEISVGARYGVSRTPAREALARLEEVGLLERVGATLAVPVPTVEELLDLFDFRTVLESAIARYAAERRREGDLLVLQGAADDCRRLGPDAPAADRYVANRAFHHALSAAAHNKVLTDHQRQLDLRVAALRATSLMAPGRWETSNAQHEEIADAVAGHDATAAAAAGERHLRDARDLWRELVRADRVPALRLRRHTPE
jgi:DNA-binding GntR family transcriptional regulator